MNLDPTTSAILLIEYQNEFTSRGGVLHAAVAGVMAETNMLANTVAVVRAARPRGVTIMHAPISFAEGYGELSRHPYGILKGVVEGKAFIKGSWGAAIVDDLAPQKGDIVIEGKRGLDTFASTNLDFILQKQGYQDSRARRFLDELLCRVDDAHRVRARLRGDHARRLRRGDVVRGAPERDQVRLPDVLAADAVVRAARSPHGVSAPP